MDEIKTDEKQDAVIEQLTNFSLFDGLKGNQLKIISKHMTLHTAAQDEILFKEGDKGDYVCFVVDGVIDIIKESPPKGSVNLASLTKGGSIGEMSVIDHFPRSATAKARTPAVYITLTDKKFDALMARYPDIGITILKGISRLLSLNLRKTSSRLADYMLPVT